MAYTLKVIDHEGNELQLEDCSIENFGEEPVYDTREKAERAKEQFRISLPRTFRIEIEEKMGK